MKELSVNLYEISWVLPEIIGIRVKRGGPVEVLHLYEEGGVVISRCSANINICMASLLSKYWKSLKKFRTIWKVLFFLNEKFACHWILSSGTSMTTAEIWKRF